MFYNALQRHIFSENTCIAYKIRCRRGLKATEPGAAMEVSPKEESNFTQEQPWFGSGGGGHCSYLTPLDIYRLLLWHFQEFV